MNKPHEKVVPESPALSISAASAMRRPATRADTPALIALVIAAELFTPHEVEPLREVLDNFHAGRAGADYRLEVWADDRSGPPVGVVYFGPNAMSDRAWELLMIAVAPERQCQGIGSELVRFTEAHVRAGGGRLLLIETSSLPKYDVTREFYRKHGYAEVGSIPDFFGDGDSKVIFFKRMSHD